jgi:hypothetical protein
MGLWVRSYYTHEFLKRHFGVTGAVAIYSIPGRLVLYVGMPGTKDAPSSDIFAWSLKSYAMDQVGSPLIPSGGLLNDVGIDVPAVFPGILLLILPFWSLVLASGSLAMILRLRSPVQFSMGNMFTAMTFLAVVLGMIAWLDRAWIGK